MREIKFRAWDKSDKSKSDLPRMSPKVWTPTELMEASIRTQKVLYDDDFIWMQYTGLKDMNGKEIYEGDVLKDLHSQIHGIRWIQDEGNLKAVFMDGFDNDQYRHFRDIQFMEVIGNIYENPELL
jgi:uncharacterized phage protein (TIGR01671 family)